ncbi:2-oxoglutarate and iron-dependent oxygenase JMJD4-like isoform X2 [Macrobrachium nipponense]|uniref:2-oxoglutarate and iron-dependent oxygenase JMJD4-like isoform X2 n=1 Tax=Macrobrachium nipponense TaxID=159736 RepID=UPI0030C8B5B3
MIELNSSDPINYDLDSSTDAISSFPRLTQPISYDDFFREFLEKNKPCVFSSEFTREWRARSDWVTPIGIPDVQYFVEQFGDADVPVADCDQKHYDSQEKKTYKLKDYIHYWNGLRETSCGKNQCLYLKDWHFVQAYPDYGAYTTLHYFASDWLNEFWQVRDDIQDDYQFVYMGPKGSCDSSKYPKAASASGRLEVIQEQGETIFVPSGWHHQVWNLEDTISINHNWLNGTNIQVAWHFLVESLNQVEFAIQDCKDMEDWVGQCQLLLRVTHGMDYKEFYTFLRTVAQRRISCLSENKPLVSFDVWTVGKNHILYDLKKIQWCLEQLLNDERLDSIKDFSDEENHPVKLLDDITTVLS